MEVVYDTLRILGIHDKPVITLYNKIDRLEDDSTFISDVRSKKTVRISAKKKIGLDDMLEAINDIVECGMRYIEKTISYADAAIIQDIRKYGQLLCEEYTGEGIFVKARIPKNFPGKI